MPCLPIAIVWDIDRGMRLNHNISFVSKCLFEVGLVVSFKHDCSRFRPGLMSDSGQR
jgi:hypothetical protein